mgnify:CR=1 FL=1
MEYLNLNKAIARLIILQRVELQSFWIRKLRKIFGRYIFTNFFSRFFIAETKINQKYYSRMNEEYKNLNNTINFDGKKILSIEPVMVALELIINTRSKNTFFTIIEKNYVSKKIVYGWDIQNKEGYNDLNLLKVFLENNGMKNNCEIYDFDNDDLPFKKFDYVLSLYSLDYHYDFSFYQEYLKKVCTENTKIIFDTIRPEYFNKIFKNVQVLFSQEKKIHSSKRIICDNFLVG